MILARRMRKDTRLIKTIRLPPMDICQRRIVSRQQSNSDSEGLDEPQPDEVEFEEPADETIPGISKARRVTNKCSTPHDPSDVIRSIFTESPDTKKAKKEALEKEASATLMNAQANKESSAAMNGILRVFTETQQQNAHLQLATLNALAAVAEGMKALSEAIKKKDDN